MRAPRLLAAWALLGLSTIAPNESLAHRQPLCQNTTTQTLFTDNASDASLIEAAENQLHWLKRQPPEQKIPFGQIPVSRSQMVRSLESFLQMMRKRPTPRQLDHFIKTKYHVYQAAGRKQREKGEMLVTAYYEPTFSGQRDRSSLARWPLYRLPPAARTGKTKASGPTRAEIENSGLFAGGELVWLTDPFDAYLLHVQGSGKIRFSDGSLRSVRYAGNNGHPYKSLGKLFVDRAILPLEKVNNNTLRSWLENHPEQRQEMLQHNPRFIFFKWGPSGNPEGSSGLPLTPGRSIAIDPKVLPAGSIGFLKSRRPLFDSAGKVRGWATLHRFVFPQDEGAAIKGAGRVDLFLGADSYAEHAANIMREPGELYFFLLKESVKREKHCQ